MSRIEWHTIEIRASKVVHVSPVSCPGSILSLVRAADRPNAPRVCVVGGSRLNMDVDVEVEDRAMAQLLSTVAMTQDEEREFLNLLKDPDVSAFLRNRFVALARGASALPDGVTRPFQGGASLFFYFLEGRVATYRCDHDLYRATANALVDLGALEACESITQPEVRKRNGWRPSDAKGAADLKKALLVACSDDLDNADDDPFYRPWMATFPAPRDAQ